MKLSDKAEFIDGIHIADRPNRNVK